ncbi:MAG: hypothetical protein R3C68_09985 [Myxococcota bacterium]
MLAGLSRDSESVRTPQARYELADEQLRNSSKDWRHFKENASAEEIRVARRGVGEGAQSYRTYRQSNENRLQALVDLVKEKHQQRTRAKEHGGGEHDR